MESITADVTSIPSSTVTLIGTSATLCFMLPFIALLIWKRNSGAKIKPFLLGALVYLSFAVGLVQFFHVLCLGFDHPVSRFLSSSPFIYAVYAGLVVSIFEGIGRYVAFRYALKEFPDRESSVMYGIGHGGMEAIIIGAISMMNLMSLATSINATGIDAMIEATGVSKEDIMPTINALATSNPIIYFTTFFERLFSMILQISLSVLVFTSIWNPDKRYLFPVAIGFHLGLELLTGFYQASSVDNLFLIEAAIAIYCLAVAYFTFRIYKTLQNRL